MSAIRPPVVQRLLFRARMDPTFRLRLLAPALPMDDAELGEPPPSPSELALIRTTPEADLSADPGGRSKAQFLTNLASEFQASLASNPVVLEFLGDFCSSPEFHQAVAREEYLVLALGQHLESRALRSGDRELAAIIQLEKALAWARRHPASSQDPGPGEAVRSPQVHRISLPAGTLARAENLKGSPADLSAQRDSSKTDVSSELEAILVLRRPGTAFAPRPLHVERLEPLVATLLDFLETPRDLSARAEFATEHDAKPAELEAFLDGLVADGVVRRGR